MDGLGGEIIRELAVRAPTATAIVIVVVLFLRHLDRRAARIEAVIDRLSTALEALRDMLRAERDELSRVLARLVDRHG